MVNLFISTLAFIDQSTKMDDVSLSLRARLCLCILSLVLDGLCHLI